MPASKTLFRFEFLFASSRKILASAEGIRPLLALRASVAGDVGRAFSYLVDVWTMVFGDGDGRTH